MNVSVARTLPADGTSPSTTYPAKYSRAWFVERLGPELVDDVLARVAAAPEPSRAKVAEVRRLLAVVDLPAGTP